MLSSRTFVARSFKSAFKLTSSISQYRPSVNKRCFSSCTPSYNIDEQKASLTRRSEEYEEFLEWKEKHKKRKRIVVAITGATGVAIGVNILKSLKKLNVETHLIISKWGLGTMKYETDYTLNDLTSLADSYYSVRDVSAPISSGSFHHDGMIVVPCSMKTLAAIRVGYTDDLIIRAADVTIKEKRKLLLCVRETPLSSIHLENMLSLSNKDVIIFPPVPAFYTRPTSIDHVITQTAGRILDCFGFDTSDFPRWNGMTKTESASSKSQLKEE